MNELSGKEKQRRLRTEKAILRSVGVMLFALAFFYIIYEVYDVSRQGVVTRTATEQIIEETLDMEVFVIRDETYIEGSPGGVIVPLVGESERVAGNADIAAVFQDAAAAEKYMELKAMKKDLLRYDSLTSQTAYSGLKVGTLEASIKTDVRDFIRCVYKGDTQTAFKNAEDFRDKATTFEIITKGTLDIADKRQALARRISALESSLGKYSMVGTGNSTAGFYMSETDGFENLFKYGDVSKLTPDIVTSLLKSKPSKDKTALGKLVCNYRWYLAAVVDSKQAGDMKKGKVVTINLHDSDVKSITAKVYAKNEDTKGRAAVIFVCGDINSQLLSLRKEKASLVLKSHKGFLINSGEIRVLKGADGKAINGVYTLRGNIISFRKINAIYSGDGFIMSGGTSSGGYVQLYDEIITSGRNLRDGAVVYD